MEQEQDVEIFNININNLIAESTVEWSHNLLPPEIRDF
jgi:hypothetical protein